MSVNPISSVTATSPTTPLTSAAKTAPLSDDQLFNLLADTTAPDGSAAISRDSFTRSKDAQQLMGSFASYDLNGDGVISQDELSGVRQFFTNFVKNINSSMSSALSSLGSLFSNSSSDDS